MVFSPLKLEGVMKSPLAPFKSSFSSKLRNLYVKMILG